MLLKTATSRNLSSNIIYFAVKLCIGVAAMPVCLHAFGEELYGLYLLGFGLSASLTAFDLGAAKSVFRYTVEYRQDNDTNKFSSAMSGAISLNIVAAIIIALFLMILGFGSESLFHLSAAVSDKAIPLFLLAGVNAFLLTINAFPQQLLNGYNLFMIRNSWQYIPLILNAILLFYTATEPIQVEHFAICTILIALLSFAIDMILIKHKALIKHIPVYFTLRRTSSTTFSNWSFVHAAISFLSIQADRLILGSVLNVSAVTTYSIITKPYFVLRGMVAAAHPTFQPGLSTYYLSGEKLKYAEYSKQVITTTFLGVFAICCWVAAFYNPLLEIWIGNDTYSKVSIWGIVSLSTACITMLYTPHYRTLSHSSDLKYILRFSYFGVPLNVLISICLSYYFGFQGVIIGTTVQVVMELVYIRYLMQRRGFTHIFGFSKNTIITAIAMFALGIAGYFLSGKSSGFAVQTWLWMMLILIGISTVLYMHIKEKILA